MDELFHLFPHRAYFYACHNTMPPPFSPASGNSARPSRPLSGARALGLLLIFALVGYGFYSHFQNRIGNIVQTTAGRIDHTGTLTEEQEQELAHFQAAFFKAYTIRLFIRVVETQETPLPDLARQGSQPAILLVLRPHAPEAGRRARVEASPLVRAALGEETLVALHDLLEQGMAQRRPEAGATERAGKPAPEQTGGNSIFMETDRSDDETWPVALKTALERLTARLDAMAQGAKGGGS